MFEEGTDEGKSHESHVEGFGMILGETTVRPGWLASGPICQVIAVAQEGLPTLNKIVLIILGSWVTMERLDRGCHHGWKINVQAG